jgi:hypothetical protein
MAIRFRNNPHAPQHETTEQDESDIVESDLVTSRLIASAVMTSYFIFCAKLYTLDLFIENSVILLMHLNGYFAEHK